MPDEPLTPKQVKTLAQFADNIVTGRRVACGLAHAAVALAALASPFIAIYVALRGSH